MKLRYRLFKRGWGVYYCEDTLTGKQESLATRDRHQAARLVGARNESLQQPAINLQIARAYLSAADPSTQNRTWQTVMTEMAKSKRGGTQARWLRGVAQTAFDQIRDLKLTETRPEHLWQVLADGTVSTNIFLRRLHNFALDMNWLPAGLIPRRLWPKLKFRPKRAITREEHEKILAGERNPQWLTYYQLLWHLGGSQSDVAELCAENIDWPSRTISFSRMKCGSPVVIAFGESIARILQSCPKQGHLMPKLARQQEQHRAALFSRRCRLVGVKGVTLHSYRYAWAERAMGAGFPERFAQEALGHKSQAVHHAYAKRAKVRVPCLEDWEAQMQDKILRMEFHDQSGTAPQTPGADPGAVEAKIATKA